ncbi:MAG: hypothetical protein KGJ35_00460, partial [Patescibacteria group bacterium]|nr:hypothetical protein [Patescibacteria group bacterium]
MFGFKRVCIFIDGENLRNSIVDLFPNFKSHDYLPKNAKWAELFDFISHQVGGDKSERIRTYWYVVQNIDFYPAASTAELEKRKNAM